MKLSDRFIYIQDVSMSDGRLPISHHRLELMQSIAYNRFTVVTGSTGSGKSTYVPIWLIEGAESHVKVLCAQPRRVAAVSLTHRVSYLLGDCDVGVKVGYKIRGDSRESESSKIVYATTGYLRTLLACNRDYLRTITHIVLDEVHERTMDSDFLSLMVKVLLTQERFSDIKLVVMSATINASLFIEYFRSLSAEVGIIKIPSGTPYQIHTKYLEDLQMDPSFESQASAAIDELVTKDSFTDISGSALDLITHLCLKHALDTFTTLVFLPGEAAIAALEQRLVKEIPAHELVPLDAEPSLHAKYFKIHILHSLVPADDQRKAMKAPLGEHGRHIVLATNIAESSLTVDRVNLVIDSGLKKESIFDPVRKIHTLRSVWTSRASLMQRRGRTGRVCNGTVIRLLTREFEERELSDYDVPESLLSNPSRLFLSAKFLAERWRDWNITPESIIKGLISVNTEVIEKLDLTVSELHATGVLTENSPDAPLTIFGSLATWLQLDPPVCQVVFWGIMLHIPVEGIVLAAAASLEKDPFKFAPKLYPGYEDRFAHRSFASMRQRIVYDMGFCSDLIMVRNLLVSWIGNRALHSASEEGVYTAPFYNSGLFFQEFEIFRSSCALIARGVQDWIHMLRGEPTTLLSNKRSQSDKALSRAEIDAIFAFIDTDPAPAAVEKSDNILSETLWKCKLLGEFLNHRKRCSLTRADMADVFLSLTTYEEADILKLIITLSLTDGGSRILIGHSAFARCEGDVFSMDGFSSCEEVHNICSVLSGGITPLQVRNGEKGVALVTAGIHPDEETSLAIPFGSEYSCVTTSSFLRHTMCVFEKAWKIDVWSNNACVKVPKPYIYNICRWKLWDDTRVYLCPRNPSAWLETRSRVFSSSGHRDNDARRRTLASTYIAVPGRLSSAAAGQQQLRAEWTTVLPIRAGGRVGLSMLLVALPGDVRSKFLLNGEGSESVQICQGKFAIISPSFPFWEELVEAIDFAKHSSRECLRAIDIASLESLADQLLDSVSTMLRFANTEEIDVQTKEEFESTLFGIDENARFTIDKARLMGLEKEIDLHFRLCCAQPEMADIAAVVSDAWKLYDTKK